MEIFHSKYYSQIQFSDHANVSGHHPALKKPLSPSMSTSWSESSEISDSRSSWEAGEGEHWELSKAPLFCSLDKSCLWSQGSSKLSSSSFLLLWGFSWMENEKWRLADHEIWKKWDTNQNIFLSTIFLIFSLSIAFTYNYCFIQKIHTSFSLWKKFLLYQR